MTTVDAPPPPHTPTRSHFLFVHKRLIRFSAFVRCILLHLCLFGESLWSKSVPSATQILRSLAILIILLQCKCRVQAYNLTYILLCTHGMKSTSMVSTIREVSLKEGG